MKRQILSWICESTLLLTGVIMLVLADTGADGNHQRL